LDGVVDPSNPNLIRGQKTNDIEDLQGGPWSKIPGKVEVIWQLER
jgi:hypothetical protein